MAFPGGSVVERTHLPMQETQKIKFWSLGLEDPLGEEMAAHSSILTWRIPWTEEAGGLQSMGSQKSWTWLNSKQQQQKYNAMLFGFRKERNLAIHDNVDEPGGHYGK